MKGNVVKNSVVEFKWYTRKYLLNEKGWTIKQQKRDIGKQTIKMLDLNQNILIIILSVNELNIPITS